MQRIIWLDDIRCPYTYHWNCLIQKCVDMFSGICSIIWVRSYDEFVCELNHVDDIPAYIFFDHDLGPGKTGMDCMKYLIDYMQDKNVNPNNINVFFQSQNPVGKENMQSLFDCYKRFYNNGHL